MAVSREKKLRSLPGGKLHSVRVERAEGGYRVDFGDSSPSATVERGGSVPGGIWSILTPSGASFEATVAREGSELEVEVGHARFRFALGPAEGRTARARATGRIEVRSPMPGKVVRILVSAGRSVAAGEPVLLFEAMKMQNELRSPQGGVVARIAVEAGQAVEARELLYVLDPTDS